MLSARIDVASIDVNSLTRSVIRVGAEHYVVKNARAATVSVPGAVGGASVAVPGLTMTIYLNPSTPTQIPSLGDAVVIFTTLVQSGKPLPPACFAGSIQVAKTAATATSPGASGFQTVLAAGAPTTQWSPPDANGITTLSVGVSAYDDVNLASAISGPAIVRQIPKASSLSAPPTPRQTVEQVAFTGPPDAYGNCSFVYTAPCTANNLYHVYRALDATLLSVDMQFRQTTGFRSLAGVSYDATVYHPDGSPINAAPLQDIDFQVATAPLADPANLTVTNWNAIANLYGNEVAFQRITSTPISASGNTLSYTDTGLPVGSNSKYFYRLRAVTASADQGPFGWASVPVQMWPLPPSRPTLKRCRVSGNLLTVTWNPNPEPEVNGYLVYVATNALDALDVRSMTLATQITATVVDGTNRTPTQAAVQVQEGTPYWVCVVAFADFTAVPTTSQNPGKLVSASSDPVSVTPQTLAAPIPPAANAISIGPKSGEIEVSFTADPNPTTRYMLLRRVSGFAAPLTAVGPWQASTFGSGTFKLVDKAPLKVAVNYVIWCTNESRRISASDEFPYAAAPGHA